MRCQIQFEFLIQMCSRIQALTILQLCVIEEVQVDLQRLWVIGMQPKQNLAENPKGQKLSIEKNYTSNQEIKTNGSNVFRLQACQRLVAYAKFRQHAESSITLHPYCEVLLTDVGSSDFCRRLPMTLDAFSAHISARKYCGP